MLCAISGEAPQVPVASRKSGNIFERRIIEAYIQENGRDPVTGEELSVEDLVDLKTARAVKPRPPTLTSIPSLLSVFQNEWDALALESYTLKQSLSQLRQELSTALYNNDAAVRVIARLTKERDEARDALARLSISDQRQAAAATNGQGDAMQIDGAGGLPADLVAKVNALQESLSKTRRKRAVPKDWVTPDALSSFETSAADAAIVPPNSRTLALSEERDLALVAGSNGLAQIYSLTKQETVLSFSTGGAAITGGVLLDLETVAVTTSSGEVQIVAGGTKTASITSHAGAANDIALHPTKEILATVGADKSFVLYDTGKQTAISQAYTSSELLCVEFHPDGLIFACGAVDGQIKIFETNTGKNAANFTASGPVLSLSFSENGTWLASVSKGSQSVSVWDLRKSNEIKAIDVGSALETVSWDYTGQFLAVAGASCVAVQRYDKSSKSWSEPLRKAVSATAVQWGANATSLVVLTPKGALNLLQ